MRPEIKEAIKGLLSLVMNGQEAEKYVDLGYAIDTVKRGQVCWQAPVSVGVHAAILHLWEKTDDEGKAVLQGLIGHALEPMEALLESLKAKPGEKYLEDERARMLFHTRFGLGFLLLAKGDRNRAWDLLREMAATKLSWRGGTISSGPGILTATDDLNRGKGVAAYLMIISYRDQKNYGEMLYLLTEAIACNWRTSPVVDAVSLLDLWAAKCESEDATQEYDFPTLNWLELFAEAAEILSLCQETDSSGALPNECKKGSAQFLAWKFGQIVARFAFEDVRWRENPLEKTNGLYDSIESIEDADWPRGREKTYQALYTVKALLCEYDLRRDWKGLREKYVNVWQRAYTYTGTSMSEIGPEADLYWAMRIGFADRMLEATTQRAIVPQETSLPDFVKAIGRTENITSYIAQLLLKQQQDYVRRHEELLQRLPPGKREIYEHLEQWLGEVGRELPSKVVNTLAKAEKYYRSEVNDDDAKVWFCKAVEASLRCCLVEPLTNFMQTKGHSHIAICFPAPHPGERMSATRLGKLSLREWSDVLETLTLSSHKGLASLGTGDLKEFMSAHLGGSRLPDLRPLARSLRDVQQYRGGSAHFEDAITRYDKEKWELEQMRNVVLGIGRPSVITQIFQLLAAKK